MKLTRKVRDVRHDYETLDGTYGVLYATVMVGPRGGIESCWNLERYNPDRPYEWDPVEQSLWTLADVRTAIEREQASTTSP